jgi:tetratricopeptide (TPR) repeat protein
MYRALRFVLATVVFVAVASATDSLAQRRAPLTPPDTGTGSVDGRIVLPSGFAGGRGLKVTIRNSFSPISTLYADRNGEFHFEGLRAGQYTVEVIDPNQKFDTVSHNLTLLPGSRAIIDMYLRVRDLNGTAPKPAGVTSVSELDSRTPPEARKEYERSVKLAKKGKSNEAIASLKRALEIYPDFPKAHNDLGVQYLRAGRVEEAFQHFETAVQLDPGAFNPRLNIGIVLVDRGDYKRAIEELTRAIAIDSSHPAAHLSLGIALFETNQLDDSFQELQKSLLLGRDAFVVAHYYEGLILASKGQSVEAIDRLETFLAKVPTGPLSDRARQLVARLKGSG